MGRKPDTSPFRYYKNGNANALDVLYYALNTETNEVRTGFSNSTYWINIGYAGCGNKLIEQDSSPQFGGLTAIRPEDCPLVVKNLPRDF